MANYFCKKWVIKVLISSFTCSISCSSPKPIIAPDNTSGAANSSFCVFTFSLAVCLHNSILSRAYRQCNHMISKSGSSDELLNPVPCARAKRAYFVFVTSVERNPLAWVCDMNVHLPVEREIYPFGLAPVKSTSIQMVFGDTTVMPEEIATAGRRTAMEEW